MDKTLIRQIAEYDRDTGKKEEIFPGIAASDRADTRVIRHAIDILVDSCKVRDGIVNDPEARETLLRCQLGISRALYGQEIGIFVR